MFSLSLQLSGWESDLLATLTHCSILGHPSVYCFTFLLLSLTPHCQIGLEGLHIHTAPEQKCPNGFRNTSMGTSLCGSWKVICWDLNGSSKDLLDLKGFAPQWQNAYLKGKPLLFWYTWGDLFFPLFNHCRSLRKLILNNFSTIERDLTWFSRPLGSNDWKEYQEFT